MASDAMLKLSSRLGQKIVRKVKRYGMPWLEAQWPGYDPVHGHHAETTAYLAHELAHWLLAPPRRRNVPGYGLGFPGSPYSNPEYPELLTGFRPMREEHRASLLGISLIFQAGSQSMAWDILVDHSWHSSDSGMKAKLMLFVRKGWITMRTAKAVYALQRRVASLAPREWA